MFGRNGFRSSPGWIFVLVDSLLILTGIFLGSVIRFWGKNIFPYHEEYMVLRMMLVVIVIQIGFYYFELYHHKTLRERKKMGILLVGSLCASSIFLTVIYYLVPSLTIGRGVFAISLFLILLFTFLWRILYASFLKSWPPKEKILIIGTGDLAKKIKSEILENGYEGFQIVGFIDEDRDKIGRSI